MSYLLIICPPNHMKSWHKVVSGQVGLHSNYGHQGIDIWSLFFPIHMISWTKVKLGKVTNIFSSLTI